MRIHMLENIIVLAAAMVGFIYGILRFLKPHKALYPQMITLGVGCIAFGRLYQIVRLATGGRIMGEFQLGFLGAIGSLAFFFSANFGTIDGIADDGSKKFRKSRMTALLAPAAALILYVAFILFAEYTPFAKFGGAVLVFFVMQTSYFNLKHFLLPDVDYGIVNCLKEYNLTVLFYSFLCIAEFIALYSGHSVSEFVISILMGITVICIVPMVSKGVKKWTM